MTKSGIKLVGALIAAALAGSGCVSKSEFEKLQTDKNQEIDALQKQRDSLDQQTKQLQSQRAALEKQQADLRAEVDSLQRQKSQLETAKQQDKSQYDGLVANLNEEVKKGQLQVRQYKDMLTVEVAEQLFFDSGKAALKDTGKEVLKKVGEALKGYDDKIVRVVGHTDNVPIATAQFPSNWELSAARATTVVRFLQANGVPPERLTASGRGEYSPIAPNDDAEGRRKNRRIEITLIDKNLAQEVQEKR
ncbi:MAG TPA: type VI secretion system protein TssL, long form [Burkholderiales bacterium]|jgi:chemotaxis protein MotB